MEHKEVVNMILANNIKKRYVSTILDGISLQVATGEIIGIAGRNGSGKSTLFSIMAGLIAPDSGNVESNCKIGYVPQESALFENLSVKDNLRFWSKVYKQDWQKVFKIQTDDGAKSAFKIQTNDDVKSAFKMLPDDAEYLRKRVSQLSGGMKKRLSIALACLQDPDILIMDEPTAALDIGFKAELLEYIANLRKEGKGVIFSTHQADELMWCDRMYILRDGVFIYEGEPGKLGDLSAALYGGKKNNIADGGVDSYVSDTID